MAMDNVEIVAALQRELAEVEARFEPLRQRRIRDGLEWDAVGEDARKIRGKLFELTGDHYGESPKKKAVRPDDEVLSAPYASPDEVPAEVMSWIRSNQSILNSDATDAVRWARIVDTQRDERYPAGETLTLYRAIAHDVEFDDEIRPGDWVTTERSYAEDHLSRWLSGRGQILEMEADGRDVLVSPTGNAEEAIYAPYELSGPINRAPTLAQESKTNVTTKKASIALVNAALRKLGVEEELIKGNGYFYFSGPKTATWKQSGVYVAKVSELTIEQWIKEYEELSGETMATAKPEVKEFEPLALEQFPILRKGMTERRQEQLAKALTAINEGMKNKAIPNPIFKDTKDRLNRIVDEAYKAHVKEPFFYGGKMHEMPTDVQEFTETIGSIMGVHDCKANGKRVRAAKVQHPAIDAMRQFFDEVEPLIGALDTLKPMAVKRQVLSAEEREAKERFVPPPTSTGATEAVWKVLEGITEKHYKELVEDFYKSFHANVMRYQVADKQDRRNMNKYPHMREGVWEAGEENYRTGDYKLYADYVDRLQKKADKEATQVRDRFIFKNLRKLASIVEAKGDFDRVIEVAGSVSLQGLSGTLRVFFKDGSAFTAQNSVVWSSSVHGTRFCRFPLTFHDVIMPNGERMTKPSEERMNVVFAGGKQLEPLELAKVAADRFAEGENGYADPEQAQWTLNENFPLEKLGNVDDLKDRFIEQCAKAEDEGRGNEYEDMINQPIHTPVVILLRQGQPYVWDGEVRVGAAARNGQSTIPAVVGVPLEELKLEKKVSKDSSASLEP